MSIYNLYEELYVDFRPKYEPNSPSNFSEWIGKVVIKHLTISNKTTIIKFALTNRL